MASQGHEIPPIHCYTNASFLPEHNNDCNDLPPPPPFQADELPPPPPVSSTPQQQIQLQQLPQQNYQQPQQMQQLQQQQQFPSQQYGHTNAAYRSPEADFPERKPTNFQPIQSYVQTNPKDRYCYIEDDIEQQPPAISRNRFGSLPIGHERRYPQLGAQPSRYEYIRDDSEVIQSHRQALRYEYIEQQRVQQRSAPIKRETPQQNMNQSARNYGSTNTSHYPSLNNEKAQAQDTRWVSEDQGMEWETAGRQIINTPKGRYASIPMQDDEPPRLPERNTLELSSQRLNREAATQKLHEILTTPRKPRSRSMSQGNTLSPAKSQPMLHHYATQRNAFTPGSSPSGRLGLSPTRSQHGTPQRALSPRRGAGGGPMTSTPTKEPSARRCLPLNENNNVGNSSGPTIRRLIDDNNHSPYGRNTGGHNQRYLDVPHEESMSMYLTRSPSCRETTKHEQSRQNGFYQGVESAFIARTAVVPPLSPHSTSDANTTIASGLEKYERKNAPVILALVGILTCGLAIYLSYSQGRRYYFDSAVGCGACCALAGASRSLRRTWTGLGLAGLAASTCAGLLLIAAKSPKPGTPLHDITAGILCGVSLLGAALAVLALFSPRCSLNRHRRVHSWIPRFTP